MDFKPPPTKTTHWSNLELTGLLEDEDSCVELERVKKHLGLYPFHLTDLSAALREILNAGLNAYDPEYVFLHPGVVDFFHQGFRLCLGWMQAILFLCGRCMRQVEANGGSVC